MSWSWPGHESAKQATWKYIPTVSTGWLMTTVENFSLKNRRDISLINLRGTPANYNLAETFKNNLIIAGFKLKLELNYIFITNQTLPPYQYHRLIVILCILEATNSQVINKKKKKIHSSDVKSIEPKFDWFFSWRNRKLRLFSLTDRCRISILSNGTERYAKTNIPGNTAKRVI